MKTTYSVECTTTGYKARVTTEKDGRKPVTRLLGRATSYEAAERLISSHERSQLQPV